MEPSEEYLATTLILIRHAQAWGNDGLYGRETPLNDLGRQQAEVLANYLIARDPIVTVYASPLLRSLETAAPLCERLRLEAVVDSRLVEFELGTDSIASILERPDLLIWRPEHKADDGESLQEFSARVAAFCDEIVERHLGTRIAVVSHAQSCSPQSSGGLLVCLPVHLLGYIPRLQLLGSSGGESRQSRGLRLAQHH